MGWSRILVYSSCFCIFLSSCCVPFLQKKFYTTEYGSDRPKKNKFEFSKKPYVLQKEDLINSNCVYQSSFNMNMENKKSKKKHTIFFRFFKDGRFITNGLINRSNPLKEYNNLKSGTIGYFKIVENRILLEEFIVGAQDCGEYRQYEIKSIKDSIVGYTKLKVEGLTGTPDW